MKVVLHDSFDNSGVEGRFRFSRTLFDSAYEPPNVRLLTEMVISLPGIMGNEFTIRTMYATPSRGKD